jgi:hypothetical protein
MTDAKTSEHQLTGGFGMRPFATLTIKLFDDSEPQTEIDWAAIATPLQADKLINALQANLAICRRQRYPANAQSDDFGPGWSF